MFFDKKQDEEIIREDLIPRSEFEKLKDLVDVHQNYLNNLYVFYDLKPTPFLKDFKNLSYEMLRLFDNICRKHDLQYWLDYSTLLGALRHNDLISWDDTLNVGMMRNDYMRLIDISDELDFKNIVFDYMKDDDNCQRWLQLRYISNDLELMTVNVYPYDYLIGELPEGIKPKGDVEEIYSKLTFSDKKEKFYCPGIEGIHGKKRRFKFKVRESEILFPLTKLQFGKYEFPAPNNTIKYIRKIYGKKYIDIPREIPKNDKLLKLRGILNIEEILVSSCNGLKKVNDDYDF